MSKNTRRAKANKRTTTRQRPRPAALCWPDILIRFTDWLIQSDWVPDTFTAYSAAMAVDRSAREREITVVGAEFPMELFAVEDYTSSYIDDCGHTPWTHDEVVDTIGLFAVFVVAERLSPAQTHALSRIADEIAPLGPLRGWSNPPRLPTALGPIALTSHLQRVAMHCEDNGSVPAACFVHPHVSAKIRGKLELVAAELGPAADPLSLFRYRLVIAAAVGAEVLDGSGHALVAGRDFTSWLNTPGQEQRHRSLVEAYAACLEPALQVDNSATRLDLSAAAVALQLVLIRSLVDDPVRHGDVVCSGTGNYSDNVISWTTVLIADLITLGLIFVVNGKYCVPDTHVPAVLTALNGNRVQRVTTKPGLSSRTG